MSSSENKSPSSSEDENTKEKNEIKEKETSNNNLDRSHDNPSDSSSKNLEKIRSSEINYRSNLKNFNARPSKLIQPEIQLKPNFYFKTNEGKDNKFIKFNKNFISYESVIRTLSSYSIDENFPESGNKIFIPSDNLRKEIFIFDPISIDINKGSLNTFIFEEILKKRAKLLFPYRQNFIKIIIIKLLQFLFIIKSKIASKKNMKNTNQLMLNLL